MGMAASQARLLTITARLADNELRSQTINNAKMRLATQSSQASENYINALNRATLKFSNYDEAGNAMSQNLTYNALTAYSSYNTQYGLVNSAGQLLVSESEAALFASANGNLNAYLLAHGLEYTTTYFDQLGAIKNDAYPAPFNNISVEDMQKVYEQYGSYENSIEVENYTSLYASYVKSSNDLVKGSSVALTAFLRAASKNTDDFDSSVTDSNVILNVKNASGTNAAVNAFKNAFLNNQNNYNLDYLSNTLGVLPKYIADSLKEKVNAFSDASYNETVTLNGVTMNIHHDRVKYTEDSTFELKTDNDGNGNKVYTLDEGIELTVNPDGNVIGIAYTDANDAYADDKGEDGTTCTYTLNYPTDDDGNLKQIQLKDFVNQMSYTLDGTDSGSNYSITRNFNLDTVDGKQKLTTYGFTEEPAQLKELITSVTDEIFDTIIECTNYEKFATLLYDMKGAGSLPVEVAAVLNTEIPGLNKTLSDLLDEYTNDKSGLLGFIFHPDDVEQVSTDLENGNEAFTDAEGNSVLVTPANLTDIDFILQYLKAKGLRQSERFNTVIKEYLVEEMIAVYGEPKYAWVDVNDTTNNGNADAKAQWYTNLFNRMNQGYKALENGLASSKEWMEYALEAGIVTLEQVDKNFRWNGLSYKTCTRITEETDEAAVTKAEAEYNRAMNDIEAKDNIFDMELKNIDTEHSALQTEYDVIKGVIDKNISRTFKFNQSA